MRYIYIICNPSHPYPLQQQAGATSSTVEYITTSEIPTRSQLSALDKLLVQAFPHDPTPSIDEIVQQPDVAHLGNPTYAPQRPYLIEPVRVIVIGSDAALSAVVTRLMRSDSLWCEVAFLPTSDQSSVARMWNLPTSMDHAYAYAHDHEVAPLPLIRDDAGVAMVSTAEITDWDYRDITAEIVVDDHQLLFHEQKKRTPKRGVFGARLTSTFQLPGLAAAVLNTPLIPVPTGAFRRPARITGTVDTSTIASGRALQAGGKNLRVIIDGISRKRPVERVTFYRHLRDLQAIRG